MNFLREVLSKESYDEFELVDEADDKLVITKYVI